MDDIQLTATTHHEPYCAQDKSSIGEQGCLRTIRQYKTFISKLKFNPTSSYVSAFGK